MPQEPDSRSATDATNGPVAPAAAAASSPASVPAKSPTRYRASIHTYLGDSLDPILPPDFVTAVQELQKNLGMPVWLLVQNRLARKDDEEHKAWEQITGKVAHAFYRSRQALEEAGRIALLIDSPGGYADAAYKIAKVVRNHSGGYAAVVPKFAKSAATLLALGGDPIILALDAELGPLDAQYYDYEREERLSALDEVQALARLHADALRAVDQTVWLMRDRTRKKAAGLLPKAMDFVGLLMRPLLDKIDTVHFSQMQRMLKEAEDYAIRLLQPRYSDDDAKDIARHLVENYSEHGFMIDHDEAATFNLRTDLPSGAQRAILDKFEPYLDDITAIGRLEEVPIA
jgi:serine dehydrogenase proteinase